MGGEDGSDQVSAVPPVPVVCCGLIGITVDDRGILERAFTEAFATQGIVPGTTAYAHSMVRVHQSWGQSAVDVFRSLFPDAPGRAEAASLAFDRSYRSSVDRSGLAPMPGAEQAISEIRAGGARVCLVTGLSRSLLGLVLETLGWWPHIDIALSPDDVPRGCPWPDLMLTAMLQIGVTDVRDAVCADGTESGILCGKRAGAGIVAGILTGGHTAGRLQGAGATHLLDSIADLPGLLAGTGAGAGTPAGAPGSAAALP